MFDPLGIKLNTAISRTLFHAQPRALQNDMLQGLYDEGFSGEALGKALDVPSIYTRINAHRGRPKISRLA